MEQGDDVPLLLLVVPAFQFSVANIAGRVVEYVAVCIGIVGVAPLRRLPLGPVGRNRRTTPAPGVPGCPPGPWESRRREIQNWDLSRA